MKRWRILTIRETDILLHPAVIAYLVYSMLTGHLDFTLTALASIILHEGAHAVTSALLGQKPGRIEITPLGAVMRLEDESSLPKIRRVLVILAGPMMSLALSWAAVAAQGLLDIRLCQLLLLSNLSILLLNLLPVLPLDGGRLLLLLLESVLPKSAVTRAMKGISITAGLALIMMNIIFSWKNGGWNLSLAFAGCCVLYSAAMYTVTHAMEELRWFLDRKILLERRGCIATGWMTALSGTPVRKVIRRLPPRKRMMFLCEQAGSGRILGCVNENALIQIYMDKPGASLHEALFAVNNRFDSAKSDTI